MRTPRIKILRALKHRQRIPPAALPAIDEAGRIKNLGVVRRSGARDREFLQSSIIVTVDPVEAETQGEMRLAEIRR